MDDLTGRQQILSSRVEDTAREAYHAVFFGKPTAAQQRKVFSDLLAQTHVFTAGRQVGLSAEEVESKREIGLYFLTMVGLAPTETQDIFSSMDKLVRMFAQNNRNTKNQAEAEALRRGEKK